MGKFVVYKSSAGSGKTHTLMVEYLSLALKNVTNYSHILAITFTNKAANEIKQRILDSLAHLANTDQENIPDKEQNLFDRLSANTGLNKTEIIVNAGKVLSSILHHYSDFAVSTIDSFMHRVIRSFAFDLKLSMSFEVELDTDSLINAAVDELISKTGKDEELTELLKNYVIRQAENDENWDISSELRKSASALFKEKMLGLIPALEDKNFTEADFKKLCSACIILKNRIKLLGTNAINLINALGFAPEDFAYGSSGVGNFFRKAADGKYAEYGARVRNAVENGEWFKKGSSLNLSGNESALVSIVKEVCKIQEDLKFIEIVRNNFHTTLLLKKINDELNIIRHQRNIVPISDFNTLIGNVVKEQPVPFIYLRAGEKFRHFMIDEFQDTSEMQWENFLPLIENSLADAKFSMLVGDGKQAIYRFKNGNAEQFVNLPNLKNSFLNPYLTGRENLLKSQYEEKFLDRNFRSREEIVNFNNEFFTFAASHFIPEYANFYPVKEVNQKCKPDNNGGQVQIDFIANDNIINRILELVNQVVSDGYSYGDIAILTRVNKDAINIAGELQLAGIRVVSSESLLLSASDEVNFLIHWTRVIANRDDRVSIQGIIQYLLIHKMGSQVITHTMQPDWRLLLNMLQELEIDLVPDNFDNMSFYDLIENLVRSFKLYESNPVYISFFLDEVLNFTQKKSSGAIGFLEYWDQKSDKLSVSISKNRDAVQILTVHKSKGLDFPVVIYAFPDQKKDIYDLSWDNIKIKLPIAGNETEEIEMPLVYRYSSEQKGTQLEPGYNEEKAKMNLDKFNLYYVAFTRASERLYVVLEEVKKSVYPPSRLAELMKYYQEQNGSFSAFGDGNKVRGWYKNEQVTDDSDVNANKYSINTNYETTDWHNRIVIARKSGTDWAIDVESKEKREFGTLVHKLLAVSNSIKELEIAIESYLINLPTASAENNKRKDELQKRLYVIVDNLLMLPETDFLFSKGTIIQEQEILTPDGESYRPDRIVMMKNKTIVVDFKTGNPSSKHHDQVLCYLHLIKSMGYENPQGFILYIGDRIELIKVKEKEAEAIFDESN